MSLPVIYRGQSAILKQSSESGFWNVWPAHNGHQLRGERALETRIPSARAERLWPQQGAIIRAQHLTT